jgi:hypothetical protein
MKILVLDAGFRDRFALRLRPRTALGGKTMQGHIRVGDIQPDMNKYVRVPITISNKFGRCTAELKFADQGNKAANERQAYKEMHLWLQEALAFYESRPDLLSD